ncbi:hypothetical protein CFC21_108771 [Triticum aestivum]|uniref:U3 small nucleolar RNA-associated protein 25 n=3 Tax=Triticinae TaxID=1648030 RepID=A0A9R1MJX5_WHEAT|nr:hypothetical protein CFC21_108771 [Triticum aestivum]
MGKLKPVSPTATPREKRRREKPKRPVLDGSLSDSSDGIIAAEDVRREKPSNESPQGLHQSDDGDSDDCTVSSEDEAHDMISNKNDSFDEMESSCSFQRHVTHVLANDEVNTSVNQKSKFNWEIPAEGIPKSKWVGTGEKIKGASDDPFVNVKGKLKDHWQKILSDELNYRSRFFSLCNSYRDIMHCNKKPFYRKGSKVDSSTMDAYLMHALSHVHRTRDVVIKNDAKLRNDTNTDILDDNSYCDQGFTRPKVLFLLPLKSIARRVVKRLIQLSPLTQKKSVKLYSNFYASDIIVASPLALKLKIDGGEVTKKKGRPKENDSDFLSSIEIVVVDYADVISMQNWSHLHAVLEQLNHLPSKEHVTNVMRIRPWYLDEHARYYRQTIILSSYLTPEMNALFNGLCLNYEGKVKLVTEFTGVLPKIQLEIRQVYERFDASSIGESDDARFEYFCTKVYPKIQESDAGGVLLFASSYFEYIRLSNFLKSQDASFCRIGEATSQQDISRARLWFFEGQKKILLYSERSHFFHRYKIRGGHHLVIYSLPGRKDFYPELVNMLGESANPRCNVLFSRLDLLKLERIVGACSARRLISSDKDMFVFC